MSYLYGLDHIAMNSKLKEELHNLIDSVDNGSALSILKEDIVLYKTTSDKNLTSDQINEIREAIDDTAKGATVSYQEFINHVEEWKRKLSSVKNS